MVAPAPSVSVAMCTHNGERFVAEQLVSIFEQSQPPTELVISDDASTDATLDVVRTTIALYRAEHPLFAVVVVVLENTRALGVAENFERAILGCSGDLIALADQDDVWPTGRLERMSRVFAGRAGLLLLHSDARLIDDQGASLHATLFESLDVDMAMQEAVHQGRAFDVLMRRNIVTGAATMIRRRLAERAAPFPAPWLHDEWLAIVAAAIGEVDLLAEPLLDYRQHGANQIGVRKLSFAGKLRRMIEQGAARSGRLLGRAETLVDRLPGIGATGVRLDSARRKLLHERARSALNRHRLARIVPVIAELLSGRYREFGRGTVDAVRDLLQPLKVGR
jgi:glycosyltransferase involved in cell wall biosynthesis